MACAVLERAMSRWRTARRGRGAELRGRSPRAPRTNGLKPTANQFGAQGNHVGEGRFVHGHCPNASTKGTHAVSACRRARRRPGAGAFSARPLTIRGNDNRDDRARAGAVWRQAEGVRAPSPGRSAGAGRDRGEAARAQCRPSAGLRSASSARPAGAYPLFSARLQRRDAAFPCAALA